MSGWDTDGAEKMALASRDWALGGSTGAGVRVAVVDTGVDTTHPFLAGVIKRSARAVQVEGGQYEVREEEHRDTAGHGTACAGIIHQVAPDAELWSVQVLGSDGRGSGDAFVAGLRWAIKQRVDICSLSMGTTSARFFGTLHDLADEAYYHGVVLVVAAANRPTMSFPALYPSVIGVSAVEEDDPLKLYYNRTPPVEFLAAGINVRVPQPNGGWATLTGNSFAAPRVSGLCALIRARHPRFDTAGLKAVLREIAEPRTKLNPAVGYP